MPLTIDEIIVDGGAAAGLVKKIQQGVAAMPPPPAPISAKAWGEFVATVTPELGALVDQVREDIAD